MDRYYYVYILANNRPTLYIGVTSDLVKRTYEHKNKFVMGFAERYGATKLVYYEAFGDPLYAIAREKQLKKWKREWKLELIRKLNPDFRDLYEEII